MTFKIVKRYYCDFCKKSGCSASSMKTHEKKCGLNPERICGLCGGAVSQSTVDEVKAAADEMCGDVLTQKINELFNWCPSCGLSACRRADIIKNGEHYFYPYKYVFDVWKEALDEEHSNIAGY